MKKTYQKVWLLALFLIMGFFHFYHLNGIPPGVSNDEANIGYEAWSIAETGKDQWNNVLPLTFKGFGNWSLPVYIYLLAPIVKVFGPQIWSVRLLGWISWVFLIWMAYLLVKKLSGAANTALAAAILTGITPWIFGLTGTASEVTLAMVFFMAGVYWLLKERIVFSTFCLLLAVLTYYGMWGFIPLYLICLFFSRKIKLNLKRKTFLAVLCLLLAGAGLILMISLIQRGNARIGQINSLVGTAVVGELNSFRGSCSEHYPAMICKLVFNKVWLVIQQLAGNYASHFSLREWYLSGGNPGILPPGGYFYLIQFPLLIAGLWYLLKKGGRLEKSTLILWLLLAPIPGSFSGGGNFTRAFIMAPAIAAIGAYGWSNLRRSYRILVGLLIVVSVFKFGLLYSSYFPKFNSIYTHYEYQPLMRFMKTYLEDNPDVQVYISSRYHDTKQYVFLLFYQKILPKEFQQNKDLVIFETEANGWIWVKRVKNWYFVKSLPDAGSVPDGSVLIGSQKEEVGPLIGAVAADSPYRVERMAVIRYLNGDPAFEIARVSK